MYLTLRSFVTLFIVAAASVSVHGEGTLSDRLKELKTQIQQGTYQQDINQITSARDVLRSLSKQEDDSNRVLSLYYAALANYRLASLQQDELDENDKDRILEQGISWLNKAIELKPDFAEAYALKSGSLGLMIDGMFDGMRHGSDASESMEKAYQFDKDNPRTYLMDGIGKLYTPSMFGGGAEEALVKFKKAEKLFREHSRDGPISWGNAEVYGWLTLTYIKLDRPEEAERMLSRGLEIEPDFKWLRTELSADVAPTSSK